MPGVAGLKAMRSMRVLALLSLSLHQEHSLLHVAVLMSSDERPGGQFLKWRLSDQSTAKVGLSPAAADECSHRVTQAMTCDCKVT